jgi:transcriptional regulator with XRE-family HTH domain
MPAQRSALARAQIQALGATVTEIRTAIRWSQRELSRRTGIPQSTISRIERGRLADPPLATVEVLVAALGGRLRIEVDAPYLGERRSQHDPAHARMSGYVARRLEVARWRIASEVEVGGNRSRGWIDLLAFNPVTRLLIVIELKTEIHDLGQIDRTLGWYEREAWTAARRLGWRPTRVTRCLLLLMTDQNDATVHFNRESLRRLYPTRARALAALVGGTSIELPQGGHALAMVDPRSKRRSWIRPTRDDGRRVPAPYADYPQFMRASSGR